MISFLDILMEVLYLTSMFSMVISPDPTSKYLSVSAMSVRRGGGREREREKERESCEYTHTNKG